MGIASLRRKIEQLIAVAKENHQPSLLENLNSAQRNAISDWFAKLEADAENTPDGLYAKMLDQDWSPLDQFLNFNKVEKIY